MAGKLQWFIQMEDKNNRGSSSSFFTAFGIFFALLLCLTTSAMVFIAVPRTSPVIALFLDNLQIKHLSDNIKHFSRPTPTPFLPNQNKDIEEQKPVKEISKEDTVIKQVAANMGSGEPFLTPTPQPDSRKEIKEIPPSASVSGVFGSPQYYTLDCEAQAASDWARYFGYEVDRTEFMDRMPVSDDPEEGFVGYINGSMGQFPPDDYGVHAGPVADVLNDFGVPAKAVRNWELGQIKSEIASGRPVIVWIVNLPFAIDTIDYTASNGNTTKVARFEHTWIVTGYNMNVLTVIDSEWTYNVKTSTFMERWNALGNQAIIYAGE